MGSERVMCPSGLIPRSKPFSRSERDGPGEREAARVEPAGSDVAPHARRGTPTVVRPGQAVGSAHAANRLVHPALVDHVARPHPGIVLGGTDLGHGDAGPAPAAVAMGVTA